MVGNLHEKRAHIISVRDRKSRTTCHSNVNKTVLSQKNGGRQDSKDDCFHKEAISSHVKLKKKTIVVSSFGLTGSMESIFQENLNQ